MYPIQGNPNASKHPSPRRFVDFSPSAEADAELVWFFNEAETAVGLPSNFLGVFTGASPVSFEAVERRAEAMHAARKIRDRLDRLRAVDVRMLAGLYTERRSPRPVIRALPRGLAGAACVSAAVRGAHERAVRRGETRAADVAAFLAEVVEQGSKKVIAEWREQVEAACANALRAYELTRGGGPSVVPEEAR